MAYCGEEFFGWAHQPGMRTVQGVLERAITTASRHRAELTVAGRTDAGVHAAHQVAHLDLPRGRLVALSTDPTRSAGQLCKRVNALVMRELNHSRAGREVSENGERVRIAEHVGTSLVVHQIRCVSSDFDARFSALQRHYRYRIADNPSSFDPLRATDTWWAGRGLAVDRMQRAAVKLLGEHDFLSLCKPRPGATTIRALTALRVLRDATGTVLIEVSADAFCHSMVRSLVGALTAVGWGQRPENWVDDLVKYPSRDHGVAVVPAHGLTLLGVDYPDEDEWAAQAMRSRRLRE